MVALQDTVAVPDPVMLLGVMAPQDRPLGVTSVRPTVPANPLSGAMVIVVLADGPALTAAGDVAAIVKSLKLSVAVVVCTRELLVPVTVRAYVPATVAEHDTVAVPEPVTLPGVMAPQVSPEGTVSVRVTTPLNPFTPLTVIVDVAD